MPSITNTSATQLTVNYPAGEAQQVITKAEYDLIRAMPNDRVKAIKFMRSQYSHSLYTAKQIVDTIQNYAE
jgi:ribosomal protein L7/L12